jgi:hypothetical protein
LDRNGGRKMIEDWKEELAELGSSVDKIKEYL